MKCIIYIMVHTYYTLVSIGMTNRDQTLLISSSLEDGYEEITQNEAQKTDRKIPKMGI